MDLLQFVVLKLDIRGIILYADLLFVVLKVTGIICVQVMQTFELKLTGVICVDFCVEGDRYNLCLSDVDFCVVGDRYYLCLRDVVCIVEAILILLKHNCNVDGMHISPTWRDNKKYLCPPL